MAEMKRMAKMRRGGTTTKPKTTKTTKNVKSPTVKTGIKTHPKQTKPISGSTAVSTCYKCMCDVASPMRHHVKTVEHKVGTLLYNTLIFFFLTF